MLEKILLPTDFGELAHHILGCLSQLKQCGLKQVILLHVIDADELNHNILESFRLQDEKRYRQIAHIKLEEQADILRKEGIEVNLLIRVGIPSNEIVKVAEEKDVSLIIGGSQRRRGKDEDSLDTTTARVIKKSKKPVLILKFREEELTDSRPCDFCQNLFNKVLHPTDWSDCARSALEEIIKLRPPINKIVLAHIMDERILKHLDSEKIEEYRKNDIKRLEDTADYLKSKGFEVKTHLHVGLPSAEINRIAREEKTTLIAIAKKGKSSFKEIVWGSTSEQVVRHSNQSVLVIWCCK